MKNQVEFTLTEQHIKLLRHMWVGWQNCEAGAPEIDPKRPYGNGLVAGDVYEILTGNQPPDGWSDIEDHYLHIHRETEHALQIVLSTGSFVAGVYVRNKYGIDWKLKL